jgi:hypothetical protein
MEKIERREKPSEDEIVLTTESKFPLRVILLSKTGKREYKLVKTRSNKLILN